MVVVEIRRPRRRSQAARWGLPALIFAALGLVAWAFACWRPGPLAHTRVRIGEESGHAFELPEFGVLQAYLEERAGLLAQRAVRVEIGTHEFRPTYSELGVSYMPDDLVDSATAVGRSLNPLESLRALLRSTSGIGNQVRWKPRITDAERLHRYVESVAGEVYRPAIPGTWDRDGQPIEGLASEELNVDLTIAALEDCVRRGSSIARGSTQVIRPPPGIRVSFSAFTPAQAEVTSTAILSQQETRYTPGTDRAVNVELAAAKIDRTVLLPGERFSFNGTVGKRTPKRGFRPAPEVRNGRLVDPSKEPCPACIGGGVCQVAGTIHATAFFAGLDILEQEPHSRLPSVCYLPAGLDTAVAWDPGVNELARTKDFVMRNPYPFAIILRASAVAGRLQVTLLGAMRPYRVECCYRVERDTRASGAGPGLSIARTRTVYKPEARSVELKEISYSDPETCMSDRGWRMRCDVCGT